MARTRRPLLAVFVLCFVSVVCLTAATHPRLVPTPPLAPSEVSTAPDTPVPPPEPPAEPAEYRSESGDEGTWTFNVSGNERHFAIVSGKTVTMNGSSEDRDTLKNVRKKIAGDFIWFSRDGRSYVIRDGALISAARKLYAPMDALGKQQEALGKQQEELGKQQEALGRQMEAVRVDLSNELLERLQLLEAEIKALGSSADQGELGRLQGELGSLQGQLGALQAKAGEAQGRVGREQGSLGAKQGELGRQQGEIGREQGRIAKEAARQMVEIINKALAAGLAKPVEDQ